MIHFTGFGVKLLYSTSKLPTKAFDSAGYDLYVPWDVMIPTGKTKAVPLGIATELPYGYFAKIMDRSSLAAKYSLVVTAGVIDNDYRGEWKVLISNMSSNDVYLFKGDRIAQAVLLPYGNFPVTLVETLSDTERGEGGFGSTGK